MQGLTEFLPVSSSGHLVIFQNILNLQENIISIDIILHLGTLLAVLIYFRKKLLNLIKKCAKTFPQEIKLIIVGSIPAMIFGFLAKDKIENIFGFTKFVGINLLITAIILFFSQKIKEKKFDLENMSLKKSFIIGLFQALAIFPGISRSGATISGASFLQIKKEDAFYFSFLLSIPAILGAVILDLPNLFNITQINLTSFSAGFLTAFISGYAALSLFKKIFLSEKIKYFSYYCFLAGITALIFL